MPLLFAGLFFLLFSAVSVSAGSVTTFYKDGALIVRDAIAVNGVIETPLSAGLLDGTLRVVPTAGTAIVSVETGQARLDSRSAKELEILSEQRQRLDDRLQALATREEIFKSAAKSQGGKTPRKSKSNPDPMQSIRQGTDFAIAQLETVYTTRRRTEQEIKKLDARITLARKNGRSGENTARITVTPARGRVTLRYATSVLGWQPHYDMHLAGDGILKLRFSARISENSGGQEIRVSPASLADSATAPTFAVARSGRATLADYRFPVSEEHYGDGIYNQYSGKISNTGTEYLPAGEADLYRHGAYLGRFRFEGLSSGRGRVISVGH